MRQEKIRCKPLNEQSLVITGATSGIGLATAKMASDLGARVLLSSRSEADLVKILKDLRENGGKVIGVVADVSKFADMENLCSCAVEAFGGVDTWINNAGTSICGLMTEIPLKEEKQLFETNFWGVRHGCRVAIPELSKKGGVLINLGSEISAPKHAIKDYSDALRMELEKTKTPVAVCLIHPALVYHSDVVAEAILACAVRPRQDVHIGGVARTTSAVLNPWITLAVVGFAATAVYTARRLTASSTRMV